MQLFGSGRRPAGTLCLGGVFTAMARRFPFPAMPSGGSCVPSHLYFTYSEHALRTLTRAL